MNRTLLSICLAVGLVALPACDDGAALTESSEAEADHVTTFSNRALTGSQLMIDGTVATTGDREGRVEIHVSGTLDKSGRDRASLPALASLPTDISFTATSMTYTLPDGTERSVRLSQAEVDMLRDAMEARSDTRAPLVQEGSPREGDGPAELTQEHISKLENRGFEVTDLGDKRYEILQPAEHGGVAVRSIYDSRTGRLENATAALNDKPVVEVVPSSKSTDAPPTVRRVE
ncbi:hypothetical protein [Longibacter sp.]|uniref:hypothetical protein n=1 Tax=Longibacter sp. TaxID=2045415 RepID=UPI003EBCD5E8